MYQLFLCDVYILWFLRVLKKFVLINKLSIPLEILFVLLIYLKKSWNHNISELKEASEKIQCNFVFANRFSDVSYVFPHSRRASAAHTPSMQLQFQRCYLRSAASLLALEETKQTTLCYTILYSPSLPRAEPCTNLLWLPFPSKLGGFLYSCPLFCHSLWLQDSEVEQLNPSSIYRFSPVLWNPHSIGFCH